MMNARQTRPDSLTFIFSLLTLALLLILILLSPDKLVSDERDFYPNISVLGQYGFSLDFLRNIRGQSPGPLYQYIYYPIGLLIKLTPRVLRLVNFGFVLADLYLMRLLIGNKDENAGKAWPIALLLMSLPVIWLPAGTALTEFPTVFFSLLSLLLLKKALEASTASMWLLAAFAGLLAGTAIIGRSPYLVVLPAALLLCLQPGKAARVLVFLLFATIFPAIVFGAWRGLVPPDVQSIQSGFQFAYVLLAIMYFGLMTLIVYPGMFRIGKVFYYVGGLIVVLSFIIDALFLKIGYMPFRGVIKILSLVPPSVYDSIGYIFPSLVTGCAFVFVIALALHVRKTRFHAWQSFLLVISLLMLLTTAKSAAHFTSKYILQAFPFFLLYIAGDIRFSKYLLLRVIAGTAVGVMSLESYYIIHAALPG